MKASELINELVTQIDENGDCDVEVTNLEGERIGDIYPCGFNLVSFKILIRIENES